MSVFNYNLADPMIKCSDLIDADFTDYDDVFAAICDRYGGSYHPGHGFARICFYLPAQAEYRAVAAI